MKQFIALSILCICTLSAQADNISCLQDTVIRTIVTTTVTDSVTGQVTTTTTETEKTIQPSSSIALTEIRTMLFFRGKRKKICNLTGQALVWDL